MPDRKNVIFCLLIVINLTAVYFIASSKIQQCPGQPQSHVVPCKECPVPIPNPVPIPIPEQASANCGLVAQSRFNEVDKLGLWRSQVGQDKYMFQKVFWAMTEPGVFVEFGARNGEEHSNTYFYEHALKWKGVLIEVNPSEIKEIKARRPNSLVLHGGVCNKRALIEFSLSDVASGVSGQTEHLKDRVPEIAKVVKKAPCYTLNEILDAAGVVKIDYMTVDTEGSEFPILNALDFDRFVINIIQIETIGAEKDRRQNLETLLFSKGYRIMGEIDLGYDTIDVVFQRTPAADLLKFDKVLNGGWPKDFDPSTWKRNEEMN